MVEWRGETETPEGARVGESASEAGVRGICLRLLKG